MRCYLISRIRHKIICNDYFEFNCAGRIYQLGLHGVRRDMSVSADHYEKATVNGHPGALGNAQSSEEN